MNSYPKVGLFMAQLKNDLGADTFARAQRAYFQEWSFRHPSTSDFFRVFERVSGRDLSTYRRNLVEGTARLDWQVVSAKTRKRSEDEGVFDRPQGRVTLDEDGALVRPESAHAEKTSGGKTVYESQVLIGNTEDWDARRDGAVRLRGRPRRRPPDPGWRQVGALPHTLRLPARLGRRGP